MAAVTEDQVYPYCQVYWGSHGCELSRGHEGDCECTCCECINHPDDYDTIGYLCVAKAPYYGPETNFYGDDAAGRGLRLHDPA